jgi:hypothetical protein
MGGLIPLIWILSFLVRLILNQRDKRWEEQHGVPRRPAAPAGGSVLATPITLGAALYFACVLFPVSLLAALWAGDRYGDAGLGLLVFVLVLAGTFQLPHWLAWRVLAPLGWPRTARLCLRLACFVDKDDRRGALQLLDAVHGSGWRPGPGKVTLWTVFALAAQAEREEDPARADLVLEAIQRFENVPYGTLRKLGLELLTWPAIRRREWRKAFYRLDAGRGRGVRLLRRIAEAHQPLEKPPSFLSLWLAWLLAPERRRSLPYVRKALEARKTARPSLLTFLPAPSPEPAMATGSVQLRHLRLLRRAAAGRTVRTAELESLATAWEEALDGAGHARLLSRGLELGVRGVTQAAEALRHSVIGELEVLAGVAEGPWSVEEGEGLAGFLRSRQIEGILEILEREMEGFPASGKLARELDPPLVELDRWYRFRSGFERLRAAGGEDALLTAWFNGLRYVACNWPVDLGKAYPGQAALACREMHLWSASLASELGDAQISSLSSNNAMSVR